MKTQKTIYILVLMLLTLSACTQVSLAPQKTEMPSVGRQAGQDVATQPEATKPVLEVTTQPEVTPTALVVTTQTEATPKLDTSCLRNSNKTRLLINSVSGYCLQYPAEYDVAFVNPAMVVLFKNSTLNATDPNFNVDVQPANGITVDQAADKLLEDYSVPGLETHRTEIVLDGVKAIVLDGLTGQDPNRQVVVVRNDTLYKLYFVLVDKNQPELYAQAEALYNTVIKTFNFHPECNMYSPCP